jgi:hypothetical protein
VSAFNTQTSGKYPEDNLSIFYFLVGGRTYSRGNMQGMVLESVSQADAVQVIKCCSVVITLEIRT